MADAGRIIPIHKGDWTIHGTYEVLDQVYYAGSTYIAKNNMADSTIAPGTDTTNWVLSARGFESDTLSGITGTDTSGLLGVIGETVSAQSLSDEISDRIDTKLIPYAHLVNNGITTEENFALDARYGKTITDLYNTLNTKVQNYSIINVKDYGATGDGITDDEGAIRSALESAYGNILFFPKGKYLISNGYIPIPSGTIIDGCGTLKGNQETVCAFLITGSDINGEESNNITIRNISFDGFFQPINIYGAESIHKPHDLCFIDLNFVNAVDSGIFLNSCSNVIISRCKISGSKRGFSAMAPISSPTDLNKIIFDNCVTEKTTGFCYQIYYGTDIVISSCVADGTLLSTDDKSCITIDRSQNVSVIGGSLIGGSNAGSLIYVAGAQGVSISGTVINGKAAAAGVLINCNNEYEEDALVKESNAISLQGLSINNSDIGINLLGCYNVSIDGCVVKNTIGDNSVHLNYVTRGDGVTMVLEKIKITGCTLDKRINVTGSTGANAFINNYTTELIGINYVRDVVLNLNNEAYFPYDNINYKGILKRLGAPDETWVHQILCENTTYKSMLVKYGYGECIICQTNSDGTNVTPIFGFNVGKDTDTIRDLKLYNPGAGVILTTPDGLNKYRISVSNTGEIVTTIQ